MAEAGRVGSYKLIYLPGFENDITRSGSYATDDRKHSRLCLRICSYQKGDRLYWKMRTGYIEVEFAGELPINQNVWIEVSGQIYLVD
jgi:hypothetical protein